MELELKEAARAEDVITFVEAIVAGEPNINANMANLAALLYQFLPDVNWVGFYIHESASGDWVLGPFSGKPACTRIRVGRGVVGKGLESGYSLVVEDVAAFPGHIACDAQSKSEVVVPVYFNGQVVAGLDVDSPLVGRFQPPEVELLEVVCRRLGRGWQNSPWY